jgi:5'-AMP-activated protein kinase catalytic alpha subunit
MKMIKHPNIAKLKEVLASNSKIYLVIELIRGGDLFDKIKEQEGGLEEETARKYFKQIVQGVEYCHIRGISHRDLKPENILMNEEGLIKISDFGLSALCKRF